MKRPSPYESSWSISATWGLYTQMYRNIEPINDKMWSSAYHLWPYWCMMCTACSTNCNIPMISVHWQILPAHQQSMGKDILHELEYTRQFLIQFIINITCITTSEQYGDNCCFGCCYGFGYLRARLHANESAEGVGGEGGMRIQW